MVTWALNLFDRLHLGHQIMIDRLADMPNPVAAVTDGELVGQGLELQSIIQPLDVRLERLKEYLINSKLDEIIKVIGITKNVDLLPIDRDVTFLMYEGPCCTEIQSGALDIRKKKLGVEDTIEFLKPVRANDGDKIASARIRNGQIDRTGCKLRGTTEPPRLLKFEGRSGLKTPKGEVFDVKNGPPENRVVEKIEREILQPLFDHLSPVEDLQAPLVQAVAVRRACLDLESGAGIERAVRGKDRWFGFDMGPNAAQDHCDVARHLGLIVQAVGRQGGQHPAAHRHIGQAKVTVRIGRDRAQGVAVQADRNRIVRLGPTGDRVPGGRIQSQGGRVVVADVKRGQADSGCLHARVGPG